MRLRRSLGGDAARDVVDEGPVDVGDPAALQGTESLYGYVVILELLLVAILNVVDTKGKGAPKHPSAILPVLGVIAVIAAGAFLQTRKRTIVAFAVIVAAYLVCGISQGPNSIRWYHFVGLLVAAVYGLLLAIRRRRGEKVLVARGEMSPTRRSAAERRSQRSQPAPRRRRQPAAAATGPKANARYTPPKPKRPAPPKDTSAGSGRRKQSGA